MLTALSGVLEIALSSLHILESRTYAGYNGGTCAGRLVPSNPLFSLGVSSPIQEVSWSLQTVVRERRKEIVDGGGADLRKSKHIDRRLKQGGFFVEAHTSYSTS